MILVESFAFNKKRYISEEEMQTWVKSPYLFLGSNAMYLEVFYDEEMKLHSTSIRISTGLQTHRLSIY